MADEFGLPEDWCVPECGSVGDIELTIGDLPPIFTPFTGPELCDPECTPGAAVFQEVRKCSNDPEDGTADVLIGSFVDGVWSPGVAAPAGFVPCSQQVRQLVGGCVSVGPVGDRCAAQPFHVQRDAKTGQIVSWFTPDCLYKVADPTDGLTLGVDYLLYSCDFSDCPGSCLESCPMGLPEGGVFDGVLVLSDVESFTVCPDPGVFDCESGEWSNPLSAVVSIVKEEGAEPVVVEVPCGVSRMFGSAGCCQTMFEVTITGVGAVTAATTCVEKEC